MDTSNDHKSLLLQKLKRSKINISEDDLNDTYIYFLTSNLLDSEKDKIIQFLTYVKDNIHCVEDCFILYGIESNEEMMMYIDNLYHQEKDKVKIIK